MGEFLLLSLISLEINSTWEANLKQIASYYVLKILKDYYISKIKIHTQIQVLSAKKSPNTLPGFEHQINKLQEYVDEYKRKHFNCIKLPVYFESYNNKIFFFVYLDLLVLDVAL